MPTGTKIAAIVLVVLLGGCSIAHSLNTDTTPTPDMSAEDAEKFKRARIVLAVLFTLFTGGAVFVPFAYYEANQSKMKLLTIDDGKAENGAGPVAPSADTIKNGTYQPLSRPIFIYIAKTASARPEVQKFVDFYLKNADKLVREVGYVPLGSEIYGLVGERWTQKTTGSAFVGKNTVGVTLDSLLATERGK